MNVHLPAADVCSEAQGLVDIDTACIRAAAYAKPIIETENVAVHLAGGRTLAAEVTAKLAMPSFDQSAMDGYAVALGDATMPAGTRLPVVGRIAAGDKGPVVPLNHAVRIFTGAPIPAGTDAVLMQEHGWRDGNDLVLHRMVRPWDNIRHRGEDIELGNHLLSRGVRLDARHVALLAAQGHSTIEVQRRLRIGVISTGNELVQPGSLWLKHRSTTPIVRW